MTQVQKEKRFDKYETRGNQNWREMMTRDPRRFNAYQQGRYDWILKMLGDVRGKRVLDAGCGGGSLSFLLARGGADVEGIEFDERGVAFARGNLTSADPHGRLICHFQKASVYEVPFPDNAFDAVASCEVIEHLAEPERMLSEVKRVLKPGGIFVLTTPYRLTEIPHDENHVKEYFPGEIENMLMKYFKDVVVKETHPMFWRSLYVYPFRFARRRPLGKWFINAMILWFGWNPFSREFRGNKFDLFSSIAASGRK